jgi:hypothetical protein
MLGKSIAALTGVLAMVLVAGCSNGNRGGGMPSVADIKAQAALAQQNNQKAVEAAQNNPSLSDAQKAALIDDLSGRHHGHGRPAKKPE